MGNSHETPITAHVKALFSENADQREIAVLVHHGTNGEKYIYILLYIYFQLT